jgi:hypothetical protein
MPKFTNELAVLVPSPFGIEIAVAKLRKYRSLHSDRILAERIEAGGETYWDP